MSTDDFEVRRRAMDERDAAWWRGRRRIAFRFASIAFIANVICAALIGWGALSGPAPSKLSTAAIGVTVCALIQIPFLIHLRRELAADSAHSSVESKA